MFLDELNPVFKEFVQNPAAFLGGFVSGVLRLNLSDEPVKSWLEQQTGTSSSSYTTGPETNGNSGPQSISID
ncbi:hypothetical protein NG798_11690 [Ancylothrix sp. C2]|uniref:hypothetical protein n=1 Tax=Ancylothrix sp. D3o TaxID=2953691 RepID=UPI0021BBA124|nr:hypothetical protein [Ancylothrix sp. D3o]MCT7950454.1 hypothetical protein [Ancylothrix sp. D3o]